MFTAGLAQCEDCRRLCRKDCGRCANDERGRVESDAGCRAELSSARTNGHVESPGRSPRLPREDRREGRAARLGRGRAGVVGGRVARSAVEANARLGPEALGEGEVERDRVIAALKRSGFPLQTRIEHEVHARYATAWRVLATEYPWRSGEGDGFVDVIANCGTVVLVIECKKAQESALLFLRPVGPVTTAKVGTCAVWQYEPSGAGSSFGIAIADQNLRPESYVAEFCVTTDASGQRRLLEHDARDVVLAIDALLAEKPMFPQTRRLGRRSSFRPSSRRRRSPRSPTRRRRFRWRRVASTTWKQQRKRSSRFRGFAFTRP
jgi:hypothetical protein